MLDDADRLILAGLAINGRVSWARLARAVDMSESTVARRAQRLFDSGRARIVGVPDPARCGFGTPVVVHLRCVPGAARAVAEELAARPDTRLVALLSGNTDVVAELISDDRAHVNRMLHTDIPKLAGVTEVSADWVLKTFKIGFDWARQVLGSSADRLATADPVRIGPEPPDLDPVDLDLVAALSEDGRLSYADLADRLEISESMAARRLSDLITTGCITFSPLIDPAILGYDVEVLIRLRVQLSHLEEVAKLLCESDAVRYLSATTGPSDLVCEAVLPGTDALYAFLTRTLADLPGIRDVETSVELTSLKRSYRPRQAPE